MAVDGGGQGGGWAAGCHLAAFIGFVGVPFGHLIGPLLVWLIKKDQYPLVDDQGREALNFQVSFTFYSLAVVVVAGFAALAGVIAGGGNEAAAALFVVPMVVGAIAVGLLALANFVLVIVAAIQAADGKAFRYPLTVRLLKPSAVA